MTTVACQSSSVVYRLNRKMICLNLQILLFILFVILITILEILVCQFDSVYLCFVGLDSIGDQVWLLLLLSSLSSLLFQLIMHFKAFLYVY